MTGGEFRKEVLKKTVVNLLDLPTAIKDKKTRLLLAANTISLTIPLLYYRPPTVISTVVVLSLNYCTLKSVSQVLKENLGIQSKPGQKGVVQETMENEVSQVKKKLKNIYYLRDYISLRPPKDMILPLLLGLDENEKPIWKSIDDIQSLFLQAIPKGGKSVALSALIQSAMLYNPELYYVMVDFKDSALCFYENFDNTTYCADDYEKLAGILSKLNAEMDKRKTKIRKQYEHIADYNEDQGTLEFPPILLIIDEISELKLNCKNATLLAQIENDLLRLIRLGRAFGIYIWITTQRSDASQVDTRFKGLITTWMYGRMKDKTTKSVAGVPAGVDTGSLKPGEFIMYDDETGEAMKVKILFNHFYKCPEVYNMIQKVRDLEVMSMERMENNV